MSRIYGGRTLGRKLGSEGCHSGDGKGLREDASQLETSLSQFHNGA